MAHDIHRAETRAQLPSRIHEPYWRTLDRGQANGFRKIAADKGYWIARGRPDDERSKKYEYERLGEDSKAFGWKEAKAAAEPWFQLRTQGVKTDEVEVVEAACRLYVKERRASKGDDCAHDAEKRFERTVYGTAFGAQRLENYEPQLCANGAMASSSSLQLGAALSPR